MNLAPLPTRLSLARRFSPKLHLTELLLAMLALFPSLAPATPLFGKAPLFIPGGDFMHAADLNGDGYPDFVAGNVNGSQIKVFIGTGGGAFATPVTYQTGGVVIVASGDVNGDGNVDLVVGNGSGYTFLSGNGDGTFGSQSTLLVSYGMRDFWLGDLNGDGKLDIVQGNLSTYRISVRLGNGDGTFAPAQHFGPANSDYTSDVDVADLNHDGNLDVVAANRSENSVSTFLGNGDGTFGTSIDFAASGPIALALSDLNNDGYPDVVYLEEPPGTLVSIRFGLGNGHFSAKGSLSAGGSQTRAVTILDATGDGTSDILVGTAETLALFPGVGNGTFLPRIDDFVGSTFMRFALANLDGNAPADLLGGTLGGTLVAINNGDGTFGRLAVPIGTGPSSVLLRDLNADGFLDLVTANRGANTVSIVPGAGAAGFGAKTDLTMQGPRSVAAGDLNGDGVVDLAVANETTSSLTLLPGLGGGAFGMPVVLSTGIPPHFVLVGDMSGDLRDDVIVTSSGLRGGSFATLFVQVDGGLLQECDFRTDQDPRSAAIADLDGDGRIDLVTANRKGNDLSIFQGIPDVVFGARADVATAARPVSVAAGDLNGDGKTDLVVACESRFISVFLGKGDRTFLPRVDIASVGLPSGVALGDIDGDGRLDIATATTPGIELRLGNGDGTFQSPSYQGYALEPTSLALADWSGDGRLDAVVAGSASTAVWALENTTTTLSARVAPGASGRVLPFIPELRATHVPFHIDVTCTVDVEPIAEILRSRLDASPNPGRGGTSLRFRLPRTSETWLILYDIAGRRVRSFPAQELQAGSHSVHWDGRDDRGELLASGVYFARLQTPSGVSRTQFTLLR